MSWLNKFLKWLLPLKICYTGNKHIWSYERLIASNGNFIGCIICFNCSKFLRYATKKEIDTKRYIENND